MRPTVEGCHKYVFASPLMVNPPGGLRASAWLLKLFMSPSEGEVAMKLSCVCLAGVLAVVCPAVSAQTGTDRGAFQAVEPSPGPLARGAERTWEWTAPGGSYMAFVRVNFRLNSPNRNAEGEYIKGDARLECRVVGGGSRGGYDMASAYVGGDQATATTSPAFGSGSDNESFALIAAVDPALGEALTRVRLVCRNPTISETALPVMIDHISVNLLPVASINVLELVARPAASSSAPAGRLSVPDVSPRAVPARKPAAPAKPVPPKPAAAAPSPG